MRYDIYLGGISDKMWRETFKQQLPSNYSVLDPFVDNFFELKQEKQIEEIAKDFLMMDQAQVLVFYFNGSEKGQATRLKLGDAVGRGKQILVCVESGTPGENFLHTYFNYRGIPVYCSLNELVKETVEILEQIQALSML